MDDGAIRIVFRCYPPQTAFSRDRPDWCRGLCLTLVIQTDRGWKSRSPAAKIPAQFDRAQVSVEGPDTLLKKGRRL